MMELFKISTMEKHFLLIISILFISCNHNSTASKLIPRDSFKSILIDIESSNTYSYADTMHNLDRDSFLLDSILIQHKVPEAMFDKTLEFYINNFEEMTTLLDEMKNSMTD